MKVLFEEREMTDAEFKREQTAFDEYGLEFGNPPGKEERIGFVATDNGIFVGASSGLTFHAHGKYGKYFYLSDLLVEKPYRNKGTGKELLQLLEKKIKTLGIEWIWTWTAEFEAEKFYIKEGYKVFTRFEDFYLSGHSRIGLLKKLN
jgi:GNAT superfamily N-acetyltransferase